MKISWLPKSSDLLDGLPKASVSPRSPVEALVPAQGDPRLDLQGLRWAVCRATVTRSMTLRLKSRVSGLDATGDVLVVSEVHVAK